MRHFDKVTLVKVQYDLPEPQATMIIPGEEDDLGDITYDSVSDAVWRIMEKKVALGSRSTPKYCCAIDDRTCGFDFASVTFDVFNWDNVRQLERTLDWLDRTIKKAFVKVCKENKINIEGEKK